MHMQEARNCIKNETMCTVGFGPLDPNLADPGKHVSPPPPLIIAGTVRTIKINRRWLK